MVMKPWHFLPALFAFSVLISGCIVPELNGTLEFTVTSEPEGAPIEGAGILVQKEIGISEPNYLRTNANGVAAIELGPGSYRAEISKAGYENQNRTGLLVISGNTNRVNIRLTPVNQPIMCGNGVVEQGEECESDAQCGTGEQCNTECQCESTAPIDAEISIQAEKTIYNVGEIVDLTTGYESVNFKAEEIGGSPIFVQTNIDKKTKALKQKTFTTIDSSKPSSILVNQDGFVLNAKGEAIGENIQENFGYIVELKSPPVFDKATIIAKKAAGITDSASALSSSATAKRAEQDRVIQKVEALLKNIGSSGDAMKTRNDLQKNSGNGIVRSRFSKAFNGFSIGPEAERAIKEIESIPEVKKVHKNIKVQAFMLDSIPLVGADKAWQIPSGVGTLDGNGIRVGVIDTGIDYSADDLGGCLGTGCKVAGGYDFVNNDSDPMDDMGHGTHVAGIIAADGPMIYGVAPKATLYGIKVLNQSGGGYVETILSGIDYAIDPDNNPVTNDRLDVVNMSLGGNGDPDDAMSVAVDNASAAGVIMVISAGNSGPAEGTIGSPGTARSAITVGAVYKKDYYGRYWTDTDPVADQITVFSSRGPVSWTDSGGISREIAKPDIVGPGAIICSTRYDSLFPKGTHRYYMPCVDEEHVQLAGTSMSAPVVAGAAALLRDANHLLTPEDVKNKLKQTARDLGLSPNAQGAGRLEVYAAIGINAPLEIAPGSANFEILPIESTLPNNLAFTVKNNEATQQNIFLSAGPQANGFNLQPVPQSVGILPGDENQFVLQMQVQSAAVKSGDYYRFYLNSNNGNRNNKIPITVRILDRADAAEKELDFGIDNPEHASWSLTKKVTVTNHSGFETLTFAGSASIDKATDLEGRDMWFRQNAVTVLVPTTFTLAPGETRQFDATISVPDNSSLENGIFSGKILLASPTQDIEIPVKFAKAFRLTIDYSGLRADAIHPYTVIFDNDSFYYPYEELTDTNETVFLAGESGNYGSITLVYLTNELTSGAIGSDNIPVNGDSRFSLPTGAPNNEVTIRPLKENGSSISISPGGIITFGYNKKEDNNMYVAYFFTGTDRIFVNDLPSNFGVEFNMAREEGATWYILSGGRYGISNDEVISNENNFVDVNFGFAERADTVEYVLFFNAITEWGGSGVGWNLPLFNHPALKKAKISPMGFNQFILSTFHIESDVFSYEGDKAIGFPFLHPTTNGIDGYLYGAGLPKVFERQKKVTVGYAPFFWADRILNTPTKMNIVPSVGSWLPVYFTQGFNILQHNDPPLNYTLKKNGSLFDEGELIDLGNTGFSPFDFLIPLDGEAEYEFSTSWDYEIGAEMMTANTKTISHVEDAVDSDPPYFLGVEALVNGAQEYEFVEGERNEILFRVADDDDNLTVSLGVDGETIPLNDGGGIGQYLATIPESALAGKNKVSIDINASDTNQNALMFTFEHRVADSPWQPTKGSYMKNNSTGVLSGTLLLSVLNSAGNAEREVHRQNIGLPGGAFLPLHGIWREGGSFEAQRSGDYRVYAGFIDSNGDVIQVPSGPLESSFAFTVK